MALTNRLQRILTLAVDSKHTADVGTDHGKLAVSLVLLGKAEHVTASDVNEGPLSKAKELVEKLGLSSKISTVCTDGLNGLENTEIDQVIIAGMGGELIRDILIAAPWIKTEKVRLILQPMTAINDLREYLFLNGYELLAESAVSEGKRVYEIIVAEYTGIIVAANPFDIEIGGFENADDDSKALLIKKCSALENRLIGLKINNSEEANVIADVITEIKRRLEEHK